MNITDAIYTLFNGWEALMSKKIEKEVKTVKIKEGEEYVHEDVEGIDWDDIDMDSFKTVSFPKGHKLVTARTKKEKTLVGVRFLLPVKKGNKK